MKKQDESLHLILYKKLLANIVKMDYGEKIPSEREICQMYSISRTTVRHTISRLEIDGYVQRVHGKGTFVRIEKSKRENLADYYSFTDRIKQLNKIPENKILDYSIEKSSEDLAKDMNLNAGEEVIRFVRLRTANKEPLMLETTFIPYERFKGITRKLLEQMALYDIFEKKYNTTISLAKEQVSAENLTKFQAESLNTSTNSACFKLYRISYDTSNNIIEHTITFVRADKFVYKTVYNLIDEVKKID